MSAPLTGSTTPVVGAGLALRRAASMLPACAPMLVRVLACAVAALFASLAVFVAVAAKRPERGAIAAVLFTAVAIALPWGFWFSRLLLLRLEARAARMPALAAGVPAAFALLLAATVLLPGALLVALAGAEPVMALSALALAAMAALLMAMLPRWCYLALCFAPMGWIVLDALAARLLGPQALRFDLATLFGLRQLPWLALGAALLAAWRWRAIVRRAGTGPLSPWRCAMVQSSQATPLWGGFGALDANRWQAHMPDWLWPAGRAGHGGPERPVEAMRAMLGTPFAPITGRQALVQAGFGAVALLVCAILVTGDPDDAQMNSLLNGGLGGGLAGGGMVLVTMYGWRLNVLRQRPAGELAELALLPGWKTPAQARRTLLLAIARPLAQAGALGTALLLGIGAAAGIGPAALGWLVVAALGLGLVAALACLRPASGRPMLSVGMVALLAATMVMLLATTMVLRPDWSGTARGFLAGGWAVVYAATAVGLAASWRRFHARAHPFVSD